MTAISSKVSVPGIVHLFGRFSSLFTDFGLGCAIDLRLELEVKRSEFEFSVVDGYKLEPFKHQIFHDALSKFWPKYNEYPLEFITKSQIPNLNGLGTRSILSLALTAALFDLKARFKAPEQTGQEIKIHSKPALARKAFQLESMNDSMISPLNTTISTAGGIVYTNTIKKGSLWPLGTFGLVDDTKKNKSKQDKMHQILYAHSLQTDKFDEQKIVIGSLKNLGLAKYTKTEPKALYDEPQVAKYKRELAFKKSKNLKKSTDLSGKEISNKLDRFKKKSGFARDNLIEMGSLIRTSIQHFQNGDIKEIGLLMKKNQNLLTILGVYPSQVRSLVEAAEPDSYGVSVIGEDGNTLLSLPIDPECVKERIIDAGGEAVIVNMSGEGVKID